METSRICQQNRQTRTSRFAQTAEFNFLWLSRNPFFRTIKLKEIFLNGEVLKEPGFKSRDGLPLFLNAETAVKVPGISPSSGYEPMFTIAKSTPHMRGIRLPVEKRCFSMGPLYGFPVLRIGNRMVVPAVYPVGERACRRALLPERGALQRGIAAVFCRGDFRPWKITLIAIQMDPPLALGGSFCVKGVHSPELLYFVYFSPHAHMAAKMSFKSLALSVAVYST